MNLVANASANGWFGGTATPYRLLEGFNQHARSRIFRHGVELFADSANASTSPLFNRTGDFVIGR